MSARNTGEVGYLSISRDRSQPESATGVWVMINGWRQLQVIHVVKDRLCVKKGHDNDVTTTRRSETTAQTQDEVKGALLLDVVIRERAPVLELLSGEDQTLLVRRNALLVLDLRLDVVDRVRGLNLKRDSLARQGLDEDLHTTAKTEDKVESRLLLDVVVGKSTTVLELLPGEDKTLLIRWNPFLVLDLRFHIVNRV